MEVASFSISVTNLSIFIFIAEIMALPERKEVVAIANSALRSARPVNLRIISFFNDSVGLRGVLAVSDFRGLVCVLCQEKLLREIPLKLVV